MESTWLQTKGPTVGSFFQYRVEGWPLSSRPEAIVVYTALLTVPVPNTVKICTDSQICIDNYKRTYRFSDTITNRRWMKIKNFTIWETIINLVKAKKLKVHMKKIKVHSGVKFNDQIDALMKQAKLKEPIKFK